MGNFAIRVENLSKLYKIGLAKNRHGTLRDHLADWAKSLFRRNGGSPASSKQVAAGSGSGPDGSEQVAAGSGSGPDGSKQVAAGSAPPSSSGSLHPLPSTLCSLTLDPRL